jgi:hypothetical protein
MATLCEPSNPACPAGTTCTSLGWSSPAIDEDIGACFEDAWSSPSSRPRTENVTASHGFAWVFGERADGQLGVDGGLPLAGGSAARLPGGAGEGGDPSIPIVVFRSAPREPFGHRSRARKAP